METRIKYVVLFLLSLLSISLTAQQKITGVVTGIKGLPLEGVTISKAGSNLGTVTNTDGSFTLSVKKGDVLIISSVGYQTRRLQVGAQPA